MLTTTERVLARYAADPSRRWQYRSVRLDAAVATILRYGSPADAAALLPAFLADPAGRPQLLPVLAEHGDTDTAERLQRACTVDGWLAPGAPSQVLHVIGYLGYEPATRLLWRHVGLDARYDAQTDACLGLAQLSCADLADEIDAALRPHRTGNLFPEYLPILANRTADPDWPRMLYEWGSQGASTDCNGGLLLGLAYAGATDLFHRALWSRHWECWSGSTGTVRAAFRGARVLGLDAAALAAARPTTGDLRERANGVLVLTGVLALWFTDGWLGLRAARPNTDVAADVYELLFSDDEPLDSVARALVTEARDRGVTEVEPFLPMELLNREVYRLETTLRQAAARQAEVAELI